MKKILLIGLLIIGLIVAAVVLFYQREINRAMMSASLFSGAEQYENFSAMTQLFPFTTMGATRMPFQFEERGDFSLPKSFPYRERTMDASQPTGFRYRETTVEVGDFLTETDTSSLLVIKNGEIRFEQYWLTGGRDTQWLSMSVAKSFVSAGIGIAVDQGYIDIEQSITYYVPELLGSAYEGVRVKDVLQMSSGAAWNEDYSDPDSDIQRMGRIIALGGSADEFVASLQREFDPGTVNRYNSTDTQALAMLLARATGRSIADFLDEYLWQPLGAEADAYWLVDDREVEMAFFGLNAIARDYAKLGELYRLGGRWGDRQIISQQWVQASTTPDAPHLMPDAHPDFPMGYGYQWWIPESTEGEYAAIGVYNQFIYVNPSRALVIVKLSAYSDYAASLEDSAYRELETIEFFREIGRMVE